MKNSHKFRKNSEVTTAYGGKWKVIKIYEQSGCVLLQSLFTEFHREQIFLIKHVFGKTHEFYKSFCDVKYDLF